VGKFNLFKTYNLDSSSLFIYYSLKTLTPLLREGSKTVKVLLIATYTLILENNINHIWHMKRTISWKRAERIKTKCWTIQIMERSRVSIEYVFSSKWLSITQWKLQAKKWNVDESSLSRDSWGHWPGEDETFENG